jgi:hypothetical protein
MSPQGGRRTGENSSKLLSHSHPWVGGNKERTGENVLSVKKACKISIVSFAQKKRKVGLFFKNGKDLF